MNKRNCALKLVNEISLYYDARSEKYKSYFKVFILHNVEDSYLQESDAQIWASGDRLLK
jgi:hypothetical protein